MVYLKLCNSVESRLTLLTDLSDAQSAAAETGMIQRPKSRVKRHFRPRGGVGVSDAIETSRTTLRSEVAPAASDSPAAEPRVEDADTTTGRAAGSKMTALARQAPPSSSDTASKGERKLKVLEGSPPPPTSKRRMLGLDAKQTWSARISTSDGPPSVSAGHRAASNMSI